jgi:hypothetical protein
VSDDSKIQWTDATVVIDRDGRRVRYYQRQDAGRPGTQQRRAMKALGFSWCRGCSDWLRSGEVPAEQGACRPCLAAENRTRYASNPAAIRNRVHARARAIEPLPEIGMDYLADQFGGSCAYCPACATTWDHVIPVVLGGRTAPGNVVPACLPCNSSKKHSDVIAWLARTGRTPNPVLLDVLALEEAA